MSNADTAAADQSNADAGLSQITTPSRGTRTLEESVNHALSAINISRLSREPDQDSATTTSTDHAAKKRRVDSGGRVRVSLLEQIQIAEEKTRNAFARHRNPTQSPAQTPAQTPAPTPVPQPAPQPATQPAPQAASATTSAASLVPTVVSATTNAESAHTTTSPQEPGSTVATAPSVTTAAPVQDTSSSGTQLVTTAAIDHLPIPIPEPASATTSSDFSTLVGTGINEPHYALGSTAGNLLDSSLDFSFAQTAAPQQADITQLNPNILSDVGIKLDPQPSLDQVFGLQSALLPTNLSPSGGNNTQFKARSLPILDNLASQILSLVSQSSFQDIAAIAAEPTSETAQAYSTMKSLFEHTRRLYSDSIFLSPFELGLVEQSQFEVLKKANVATFVASIVGSRAIDFSELNNRFLDIFAPDGNRLLKGQGALYLELKTQAFVSGLLSHVRPSNHLLNEFFPEDLEQQLLMRRQNNKQLAPSELEFVKRCQSRRDIILNEMRSASASTTLQERYQWENFLKELCGFIGKNFEGLSHHKKHAKPQQGQQQPVQEQQQSQSPSQQQQIQHIEQGLNQPSQFAATGPASTYAAPAPSNVTADGLFDASTSATTQSHYQQQPQQQSPSYGSLQPSSTAPLSASATVASAPDPTTVQPPASSPVTTSASASASAPAPAPVPAPDSASAPTPAPATTAAAAQQPQKSAQPSPSPAPSRSSFSSDLVARAARAAQIALQGQLMKSKPKPQPRSPQTHTQPQPSPGLQTQAQQLPQQQQPQQQQQVTQVEQPQPQAPVPVQQVQPLQQQPSIPPPAPQQPYLPLQPAQPLQFVQHQALPLPTQVQPQSQPLPQTSSVQVGQTVQPAPLPSRPARPHVSQHFQVVTQQQLDQKFGVSSSSHASSPALDPHTPTTSAQPLPPQPQAVMQQPFSAQPQVPQHTPASRPQPVQITFQQTPPLQFHQYTPPSSLASQSSVRGQYQAQNSFTYAPGLPHYSQSQPTQVLYERARQAASARPAPSRRSILPSQRRPWTTEEENALMAGLDRVKGPHWAQILQMFGPGGTINETLKDRNQVQLKDKARNLKLFFLKSGIEVPYYLKFVTGELKTRAPAQAAKQEARERERQRGEEDKAHVEGFEGMMALSNNHSMNFTPGVKSPVTNQQTSVALPHGLPPVPQQASPPQLQSQPQQYPSQSQVQYTQPETGNTMAAPPPADAPTAEQIMERALMQSLTADIKNEPIPYHQSPPSLPVQSHQQQQQQQQVQSFEFSTTQDQAQKPASEFSLQYPTEATTHSFQKIEDSTLRNHNPAPHQSDGGQKLEQEVGDTQTERAQPPEQPQQSEQPDAFQMVMHLQTHNEQHTQQQMSS